MPYITPPGLLTRSLHLLQKDLMTCSTSCSWWVAAWEFKPRTAQYRVSLFPVMLPTKSDDVPPAVSQSSTSPQRLPTHTHHWRLRYYWWGCPPSRVCCTPSSPLQLLVTLWMSAVHRTLSPRPCSAPADSSLRLLLWGSPPHVWSPSSPEAFWFPQHYCLSRRTLPSRDVPEKRHIRFCHFCL